MKARSGRSEKAGRLEEAIESMAIEFANGILGAIRAAPMDELLGQMRNVGLKETRQANREASRPAGVPARASAPRAGGKKPGKPGKRERLARRGPGDLEAAIVQIVALLTRHPEGLRSEEIRTTLDLDIREMPRPLQDALAAKRIKKTGDKRATTYFSASSGATRKAHAKALAALAKSFAYTSYEVAHGSFGIALCERGVKGYQPVDDYGPYADEARAKGIAERLNERLGVSKASARTIVMSTMLRIALHVAGKPARGGGG